MKFKFTILAFILLSTQAYSQSKNTISVLYAAVANDVDIHGVIGDFGFNSKHGTIYGMGYTRSITKHFSLESGLYYSDNDVQISSIYAGYRTTSNDVIKMLSVPLIAKISFLRYLYVDGGLTADFQTNYTSGSVAPDQSGIGIEGGIGAQYSFGPATIFVNPFFQEHRVIGFKSGQNFNLLDSGFKFGVGLSF